MAGSWIIHLVDDDDTVRAGLLFALEVYGYRAVGYVDAQDFLSHDVTEPGVVISDLRMPGISGIELARKLKQERTALSLILVTGHADEALKEEAIGAGAKLVMEKPIALAPLLAEIDLITAGWH